LIDIFQQYGAVVGIELPMKNLAVEQELKEKMNQHEVKRKQETEISARRA
jgi:hypothetical protein